MNSMEAINELAPDAAVLISLPEKPARKASDPLLEDAKKRKKRKPGSDTLADLGLRPKRENRIPHHCWTDRPTPLRVDRKNPFSRQLSPGRLAICNTKVLERYYLVRFDELSYSSPWMDAVHEVYRAVDEARDVGYYSLYGREASAVDSADIQEVYSFITAEMRRPILSIMYMVCKMAVDLKYQREEMGMSYQPHEEYLDVDAECRELLKGREKAELSLEDLQFAGVCRYIATQEKFNISMPDETDSYHDDNFLAALDEFDEGYEQMQSKSLAQSSNNLDSTNRQEDIFNDFDEIEEVSED